MRDRFIILTILLIGGIGVQTIISCSPNDNGVNEQSYQYCITANNTCLAGPFTVSTCTGQLSNSCPDGSSSSVIPIVPSSSSNSNSSSSYGSSVLYQGKTYKTVLIGTQTWMAENLDYAVNGSVCYNNDPANCNLYGRLYNWETAMTACPSDWHLPSNGEWDNLFRFVDNENGGTGEELPYCVVGSCYKSETAGRYLKATSGWSSGGNGTDNYGFSALPGGKIDPDGNFLYADNYGYWWTSSEFGSGSNQAYYRYMVGHTGEAGFSNPEKEYLHSVRCVKD